MAATLAFSSLAAPNAACVNAVYRRLTPDKIVEIIGNRWDKERFMANPKLTRRGVLTAAGAIAAVGALKQEIGPLMAATPDGFDQDFKETMTTMFWVGEAADAENDYISNHESYWDKDWLISFGGVDDPIHRNGHWPAGFTPKENPFYVALPYGEFTERGRLKVEARGIPWYRPDLVPLLKNRWVEIRYGGRSCYAQWQDVGPCGEDDFPFVFGAAEFPKNTFDAEAGLDVSPAVWHHLGMSANALTVWRFVDASAVPEGPWTEIVTVSPNNR